VGLGGEDLDVPISGTRVLALLGTVIFKVSSAGAGTLRVFAQSAAEEVDAMVRGIQVELDAEAGVNEGAAADLVDDLRDGDEGLEATIEVLEGVELVDGLSLVALISLAMTTGTGATLLAAFAYRVFHTGVTIICKGDGVQIKKNKDLPKGSAYIVHCDGTEEFRETLSEQSLSKLITALIEQ
jgi:hypothetical protein